MRRSDKLLTGARCECARCGQLFNSIKGFDRHRAGPMWARRCLTSAELTARGWERNRGGYWITERRIAVASELEATIVPSAATTPQARSNSARTVTTRQGARREEQPC